MEAEDSRSAVLSLLRQAQTGDREQALALAEEQLRGAESPGNLYARAIALQSTGDHAGAARTAERILAVTASGGGGPSAKEAELAGWRSIALSYRAWKHIVLSEIEKQAVDLESILLALAQSEALLSEELSDMFVLSTAHTCLGNAFNDLRLYELAKPHYEAALAAATAHSDVILDRAVSSQINLATTHLNWAMELHRIGDSDGAREKSVVAAEHARAALDYAASDEDQPYAAHAGLLFACADSAGGDDRVVVARIRHGLKAMEGRGARESRAFALPFLARALARSGEHAEAVRVAEQACGALTDDATWLTASPAHHTLATLLAESGSEAARAALVYGNQLADTLWRQRLRTLDSVRSMQFVERVTGERDRVEVLARTDALTGVGNRRAFDVRIAELSRSAADSREVAMIVVDVDGLKAINDAEGHEAGDRALQAVAGAMSSVVRAGDLVARLGGDEFVVILEDVDAAGAAALAARMVEAVAAGLGPTVTVSHGVATGPRERAGLGLLRAADKEMYAAKRSRRIQAPEDAPPPRSELDRVVHLRDVGGDPVLDEDAVPDHEDQHGPELAGVVDGPAAVRFEHGKDVSAHDQVFGL